MRCNELFYSLVYIWSCSGLYPNGVDNRSILQEMKRLYLDCDGVLADFDGAFLKLSGGLTSAEYQKKYSDADFWNLIREAQPPFFTNLQPMPDAYKLLAAVEHLRPIVLTGCPWGGWAEVQKILWCRNFYPGIPLITALSRDKRQYCLPGDVLVDDQLKYSARWLEAGGVFIHHTSAESSIEAVLKEFDNG